MIPKVCDANGDFATTLAPSASQAPECGTRIADDAGDMRIEHHGRTDTGRRDNNEDGLIALSEHGLYAVADGMGGYEGGEVASRLALASLQAYFELLGQGGLGLDESEDVALERMGLAVRIADREVTRRATGRLSKMGTTLACVVVQGTRALIAHVGDSRVYRLRDGEVERLTRDHSLVAEMEAAGLTGASQRGMPFSNIITQALGQGPDARPDLRVEELMPGDRFLLCSDGVTDALDDEAIAWALTSNEDPADAVVDASYMAGSADNITALVLTVPYARD